jgi:predicted O-methyltransferase YrrM
VTPSDLSSLANPPPFDDILSIFVEEDWKHFQHDPAVLTRRCYNFYAAYGAAFRPRAILEIGVRRGYSAHALVCGAAGSIERFVGLDFQEEGAEMIAGARDLLVRLGVASVEIRDVDTQLSFPALTGTFSLIHVDADHSTRGALSDLANALPLLEPGGVIVVDDYDHPPVAAGVQAFLAVLGPQTRRQRIANYRGHMLIWPGRERFGPVEVFSRLPAWAAKLIEVEDLVVAARLLAESGGPFALRALSTTSARALAALDESRERSFPSGALPGLQVLVDRAVAIAMTAQNGPHAQACAEALAELRTHVRYCVERSEVSASPAFTGALDLPAHRDRDGATTRALLKEFSVHVANFAGRVAAPLLTP